MLPIVEAIPKEGHTFYDFDSRYTPGLTDFIVPAELEPAVAAEVEAVALATYVALGCRGIRTSGPHPR